MQARGNCGEGVNVQTKPDAFDVVKKFLADMEDGRVAPASVRNIRMEVYAVAARIEKVRKLFPDAQDIGLGDGMVQLLKMLKRGRGLLDQAALF